MTKKIKPVNIYTDGACSGNQNKSNLGGWGSILEYGEHRKENFGGEIDTTNNRMELTALFKALEMLKRDNLKIRVFSDSSYLVRCLNDKWYENWIKNGWVNTAKKPVENKDLWSKIITEISKHDLCYFHVKGHVNLDNDKTDVENLYKKFIRANGDLFTLEEYKYIIKMNNRADYLANEGIKSLKDSL